MPFSWEVPVGDEQFTDDGDYLDETEEDIVTLVSALKSRIQYLVNVICTERGADGFTFPDGEFWPMGR